MAIHLGDLAETAGERGSTLIFEGARFEGRDLHRRSTRLAGGLAAEGIDPGDRVVVLMANCPEVVIAYTALWRAGAVPTPVVFLVTVEELRHVLTDSGAVAVLTTPEFAEKVRATRVAVPVFVVGEESFAVLERNEPLALVPRAPEDLAALLYTGGTTGQAKGVMLTHANLWSAGQAGWARVVQDEAPHGRSLTALPLSHAYGLLVTVVGMFFTEPPTFVLQRWFHPQTFLALASTHQVDTIAVVPSMVQLLLDQPLESIDLSALSCVASGGSPLPVPVLAEWERRVPGALVLEGYGMTETGAVISSSTLGARRVGAVGRPAPGVEVRIWDADGRERAAGADGEIVVRGPVVMPGYWGSPKATAATLRDGWLHTGDLGHLDRDGFLYVVDRIKDLIIRGGFNVYPRDIEDVLLTHPAVAAAGVVGRPDPVHGEEVVAFVALRPGEAVTRTELYAWAKERVSAAKYPRELHLVKAIPLTSVGKIDRKALRRELLAAVPAS